MLNLSDDWVWDFWTAHDGARHHVFFLQAPRHLGDPDLRHHHASVGHAVSEDLREWTRLPTALSPQGVPAFDDLATWTGSVVRDDVGTWWMFTSGISVAEHGLVQRIGAATSQDLSTWTRTSVLLEADPRWYAVTDYRGETHWRDPYVTRGSDGRWHLYLTAKVPGERGNAAIGHAISTDLRTWTMGPPLNRLSSRFDQAEVISLAEVEGRWALMFSCLAPEIPGADAGSGGVWSVPVDGPGAPVELDRAVRLTSEDLYVGRVVEHAGRVRFLAFDNGVRDEKFVGGIIDPVEVAWLPDGSGLTLVDPDPRYAPSAREPHPLL